MVGIIIFYLQNFHILYRLPKTRFNLQYKNFLIVILVGIPTLHNTVIIDCVCRHQLCPNNIIHTIGGCLTQRLQIPFAASLLVIRYFILCFDFLTQLCNGSYRSSQKTSFRNYIFRKNTWSKLHYRNVHFPECAFSRNCISLNVYFP